MEVFLTQDKTEWEQRMRKLLDEEVRKTAVKNTQTFTLLSAFIFYLSFLIFFQIKSLTQRRNKVEEYEKIIHNLMFETITGSSILQNEKLQVCMNVKIQLSSHKSLFIFIEIIVNSLVTKTKNKNSTFPLQVLEREQQKLKGSYYTLKLKQLRKSNEVDELSFNLDHMKKRTFR